MQNHIAVRRNRHERHPKAAGEFLRMSADLLRTVNINKQCCKCVTWPRVYSSSLAPRQMLQSAQNRKEIMEFKCKHTEKGHE